MSTTKTITVRVNPRLGRARFFRAGLEFTQEWQEVDADAATVAALEAEQMLEVLNASVVTTAQPLVEMTGAAITELMGINEPVATEATENPVITETIVETEPTVATEVASEAPPTRKTKGQ